MLKQFALGSWGRAEAAVISVSESSLIPTEEEDKDKEEAGGRLQEGGVRMWG